MRSFSFPGFQPPREPVGTRCVFAVVCLIAKGLPLSRNLVTGGLFRIFPFPHGFESFVMKEIDSPEGGVFNA